MYVFMVITYFSRILDQPSKAANPARGQLNREKLNFPCSRRRLRICSRETGSAASSRVSLLILYTRAESCAYSRDSSRFPRRRPCFFLQRLCTLHIPLKIIRIRRVFTCEWRDTHTQKKLNNIWTVPRPHLLVILIIIFSEVAFVEQNRILNLILVFFV